MFYKLKDACGIFNYVFEEFDNDIVRTHHICFYPGNNNRILIDDYDDNIIYDIHSYGCTMEELMELDYLGYSLISENEYWEGVLEDYLSHMKYEKDLIKESINSIKKQLKSLKIR